MHRNNILKNSLLSLAVIFMMGSMLTGCGGNDKEDIVGIWRVKSSKVEGREVGDGKGWFEFKKDGNVSTRPRPGKYDSGKYTIDPEKKMITLNGENGGSMNYQYVLDGDVLTMDATLPNDMKLAIDCERVDDYPITKENDGDDSSPMIVKPGS